nr:hypothetical protein [uncultured Fluviicola sp.]
MREDETRLFSLLAEFISGGINFEKFASAWDNCYVESNEKFENEDLLSEIKDKLDYSTVNPITEIDRLDGLISVEELIEFLRTNTIGKH